MAFAQSSGRFGRAGPGRNRGADCLFELGEAEGLQHERDGLEGRYERRARLDARAHERKLAVARANREDRGEALAEDGLEHGCVDLAGVVLAALAEDDGLVAETRHDVGDEPAHLGRRLRNEYPCHVPMIRAAARIEAGFWYGRSMNRPNQPNVLVVDDDPDVRGLVVRLLEGAGYDVTTASDGQEGLRALYGARPDLVVLDLTMPRMDGWQTLERIREVSDVPVLVLTGRAAELETVRGLKAGADDYVTKPFRRQELLARVQALLRRGVPREDVAQTYEDDVLRIDFPQRAVTVSGRPVALTPTEFRLLTTLVRHPNQVLSREQILELVWSDPYAVSPDQVKLYVGYLRRKLDVSGARVPIETVRGFGYRYSPPR